MAWRFKFNSKKGDDNALTEYEFALKLLGDNEALPDGTVPTAVKDKPDIDDLDAYYISAFDTLSGSRSIGMDIGPIPISEMTDYCIKVRNDKYVDDFIYIVQTADQSYLKEYYKSKPK